MRDIDWRYSFPAEFISLGAFSVRSRFVLLPTIALLAASLAHAQTAAVTRFPADKAISVNPDTHLVLTFGSAPSIGKSGQVRIYDAADHRLVDTLDLSI